MAENNYPLRVTLGCKVQGMVRNRVRTDPSGFTIVEIVSVLMIIGIVGIATFVSVTGLSSIAEQEGEIAKIRGHLRFSQAKSMADTDHHYGIYFDGDAYQCYRFRVQEDSTIPSGSETAVRLPGEDDMRVTLTSGLSLESPELIGFNSIGVPMTASGFGSTADASGSSLSFGYGNIVTITDNTGFIH